VTSHWVRIRATSGIAGYAFEEYSVSENTRLQAGMRYDYKQDSDSSGSAIDRPGFSDSQCLAAFKCADRLTRRDSATYISLDGIVELCAIISCADGSGVVRERPRCTERHLYHRHRGSRTGNRIGRGHVAQGNFANTSFEISPFANSINHYIYGFLRGEHQTRSGGV